jgi:hypothetical protein
MSFAGTQRRPSVQQVICRLRKRRAFLGQIRAASHPRTFRGIPDSIPSLAERSDWERGSKACDPVTTRRRALRNEREDANTRAHNTLSAGAAHVQVFYPFHPLHGKILRVICRPKTGDGAVTVMEPSGRRLKIPVWMLASDCAGAEIKDRAHLGKEALLTLASLLTTVLTSADAEHDNLLQTAVDGGNGGQRDATATSGRDDRKARRTSAVRRSRATRADRSDGQHSGGGI